MLDAMRMGAAMFYRSGGQRHDANPSLGRELMAQGSHARMSASEAKAAIIGCCCHFRFGPTADLQLQFRTN